MGEWRIANDELRHYASEYYDPQKAHEYYEEHKKLKGRSSTSGLNEEGKKIAGYVKKSITEEKEKKLENERSKRDSQITSQNEDVAKKIDELQSKLNAMSPANRKENKLRFKRLISSLREDVAQRKAALQEAYKQTSTKIKTDADEKYNSELSKLQSEYGKSNTSSGTGGQIRTATTSEERNNILSNMAKKK